MGREAPPPPNAPYPFLKVQMATRDRSQGFAFAFPKEKELNFNKDGHVVQEYTSDLREEIELAMSDATVLLEYGHHSTKLILDHMIHDLIELRKKYK